MAWVERHGRTWRVRFWKGDGTAGSIPGFTTKGAARAHADSMNNVPDAAPERSPAPASHSTLPQTPAPGPEPKAKAATVGEWAETWWQTTDVGPNTEAFYRSLLTRHILSRWAATPADEVTPAEVKIWLKRLRETYAPSTVTSIRKLFAMLMGDAVDDRLLTANPVRPERRGRGRLEPRKERAWADEHQVLAIAQRVLRLSSRNQCLLVITAAYTGMRWGELAALHRDNIDLHNGRVHITAEAGALHEVNGTLTLGHPKTRASVRTVALPPFLAELLRIDLASSARPFVFTTLRGHSLRRSGFQRRLWAPAVRGGNLSNNHWAPISPDLTFHGLRHSHKTWLIEDGIAEVAQARRLGHAMQDKMDDTYAHVAVSINARLLDSLEARWNRSIQVMGHSHGGWAAISP